MKGRGSKPGQQHGHSNIASIPVTKIETTATADRWGALTSQMVPFQLHSIKTGAVTSQGFISHWFPTGVDL